GLVELAPEVTHDVVRPLGLVLEVAAARDELIGCDAGEHLPKPVDPADRLPPLSRGVPEESGADDHDEDDDEGGDALELTAEEGAEVRPQEPEDLPDAVIAHGGGPFVRGGWSSATGGITDDCSEV